MDLLGRFHPFSQEALSFMQSTAVCSATSPRYLLLQHSNPCHIISDVTTRQAAAQLGNLGVLFYASCVMSIYLSIDLYVNFCPALHAAVAAGTSAIPLIYFCHKIIT